ncbi:aspartate aminotransferase family protein [Natrialba swarupiae]|uniref:Aspartate aminotransferase family protein n=1 Tax=Natrialba swarupiae TaxID=2448032 RepID=A0A5D5AJ26_9EURY|nr:aspartate aminotransferase family protein [Natrialba swarupiae]TYT60817.1 aspartate aminotransferase family protein [Natrialba swarupiae]
MKRETTTEPSNADVEAAYDEYVMPIWKSLNVPVERASNCTLEDFEGTEYLDLFSGISVANLGHNDEAVVEAATEQLETFVHGCSYVHPNQPVAELAERLAELTPGDLQKSFFCNSGTEAVEGAIKLARKYTGNQEVVALEMGFHGRTLGSLALTGNHAYKHGMGSTINDVVHAPAPDKYRSPHRDLDDAAFAAAAAADLERTIGTHTSGEIAAVVVEPVMGEGGIIVPPADYLERVAEIARDHGGVLIADEVQTGYGRTGEFWAVDHVDVEPDILTQAKGIANGLPLGAFTASAEIADAFESGDHLSTFGGNPVSCAAALATIDRLEDDVIANARDQGEWLAEHLGVLADEYDVVGDVRGRGLMWGLEIVAPDERGPGPADVPAPAPKRAAAIADYLREEEQIVAGVGGYHKNVVRLQPPLSISREQLERALEGLRAAVDASR